MPGPVSDCYDPEFSTTSNRYDVEVAIKGVVDKIARYLGPELKDIVGVVQGPPGNHTNILLSEREMRVIRFGLNRALEDI